MVKDKQKKQDVSRIFNHISLMNASIQEHHHDIFKEISLDHPEEAVKRFPEFLDKILSEGNGFFSGKMCGGPYPPATIPLFNTIGSIYPELPKNLREIALQKTLNFLDKQNYILSQEYVENISEPWLVGDIIINRWLYWSGYAEYANRLKGKVVWSDLEGDVISEDKEGNKFLNVNSDFWFTYTVGRASTSEHIRKSLTEKFPDLVERTKDATAAIIAIETAWPIASKKSNRTFYDEAMTHLVNYAPEWRDELITKINARNWVLFPERYSSEGYNYLETNKGKLITK